MRSGPLVTVVYPDLEALTTEGPPLRRLVGMLVAPGVIHVPEICGIGRHAHIHVREWLVQLAQVRPHDQREAEDYWRRLGSMRALAAAVACPGECCQPVLAPAPVALTTDLIAVPLVGLVGESVNTDLDVVTV